jgi:hypothetical protein
MAKYTKVRLHMTTLQKKKLIQGKGINLKYNNIGNGEIYHLKTHQCNKLGRAMHKQKGCRIDMDDEQIEHHYKHGGGMFSFLKQKLKQIISNPTVRALGKKALNFGIDAGTNYVKSKTDGGFASNMALDAGSALAKNAVNGMGFVGGMGIKRRRRGAGFRGGL